MSETLRGGVIGAGVFGTYHARQYARLPGVALAAVLDPHPERGAALAMPLGGRAFTELDAFLDAVDVVTVVGGRGPVLLHSLRPPTRFIADHLLRVAVVDPVVQPIAGFPRPAAQQSVEQQRDGLRHRVQ